MTHKYKIKAEMTTHMNPKDFGWWLHGQGFKEISINER